jgi:hypothetical protein
MAALKPDVFVVPRQIRPAYDGIEEISRVMGSPLLKGGEAQE